MARRKGAYSRNREAKYISLRGLLRDPNFLNDAEVREIVIYTAGLSEYQNKSQVDSMMKLSGNIDMLRNLGTFLLTKNAYSQLIALRDQRKYSNFTQTRADAIASFMNLQQPHNIKVKRPSRFERTDGKPRAIEKIGSSAGKISVSYKGFDKVNKDFEAWFRALGKLGAMSSKNKPNLKKSIQDKIK